MPISPKASWTSSNLNGLMMASIFFITKFVGLLFIRRKFLSGVASPFASAIPMGIVLGVFFQKQKTPAKSMVYRARKDETNETGENPTLKYPTQMSVWGGKLRGCNFCCRRFVAL